MEEPGTRRPIRAFDSFVTLTENISAALIWLLAIAVSVNILLRRFLRVDLGWLFEATEYSLLLLAFLGGASLLRARGHVSVDLAGELVLRRKRAFVVLVGDVGGALVVLVMLAVSSIVTYQSLQDGFVTTGIVEIPRWWIFAVLPAGFAMMAVQAFRNISMSLLAARNDALSRQDNQP